MADKPQPDAVQSDELATIPNALALNDLALLGTFGPKDMPQALVRHRSGRVQKVTVGDRLSGGRVVAVSDHVIIADRKGKTTALRMPGAAEGAPRS